MSGTFAVWRQFLRGQPAEGPLSERLERLYAPQAAEYDASRERLLPGRAELARAIGLGDGEALVDLGAGTGRNLDYLGERAHAARSITQVDLCPSLLAVARDRARGRPNVRVVEADATSWRPDAQVDVVLASYSLTMIPDWFRVVDAAHAMLRPGGRIGVVDFYVSRRVPPPGMARHGAISRAFWPAWFSHDGVNPSPDHLPYLSHRFRTLRLDEATHSPRFLPFVGVPWYLFVGQKD